MPDFGAMDESVENMVNANEMINRILEFDPHDNYHENHVPAFDWTNDEAYCAYRALQNRVVYLLQGEITNWMDIGLGLE